jgi:hypothetical protein
MTGWPTSSRSWARTSLETLLLAERAALLSGRDDEFTMIVAIGYTGLRWGETIGLERGFVTGPEIHVEWQLREINGRFHRLPPKDDSYRSPNWEPCLPVDLPEFLARLLARQAEAQPAQPCACASQHGGSGQYLFLAEDGIPEILAEQRLGHEVPGMRGLYAHASGRMRDHLTAALQARWTDSLRARAAMYPRSPVPLRDELLAPFRPQAQRPEDDQLTHATTPTHPTAPGGTEKMISQIPPNNASGSTQEARAEPDERASYLVRHEIHRVELWGFEPQTPSMRTRCATGLRHSPKTGRQRSKPAEPSVHE